MTKVLLIVEGEKEEKRILEKVLAEYRIGEDAEIYPYRTTIYELYERMFLEHEDELETLRLIDVLRARDKETKFLQEDFSDILLIFDYDPQDNRFTQERLELMLDYFNESTQNGKLYINYPMVESYKHFKAYPEDVEYKNRIVQAKEIKQYKSTVSNEAKITDIRKMKREHFNSIIKQNIKKANYILNEDYEIEDDKIRQIYQSIDTKKIARKQNELWNSEQAYIHILNTCLFFICDYKFQLILE